MASVLMKTFPAAFRSLPSSTSRHQLFNIRCRTFERFESPSVTPWSSVKFLRVECYSSCTSRERCLSPKPKTTKTSPTPRCYSWNSYSLQTRSLPGSLGIIKGKQSFAHIRRRSLSLGVPVSKKRELVTIHFINRDGEKLTVKTSTGQNLLDVVVDNDLDIDGYGACEGTLSCSTCHLIFSEELFKSLPKPSDEELDMLDLAYGQTDTSRLGCQVVLRKDMDGMTFIVPDGVSDARDV